MSWPDRKPDRGGSGTMEREERIPWTQTQVPPPGTAEGPGPGRQAATDGLGQGKAGECRAEACKQMLRCRIEGAVIKERQAPTRRVLQIILS